MPAVSPPIALFDTAGARELDRLAIAEYGIADGELMARAGAAALAVLRRRYPRACTIAVACGPGNNGGDGYVLARLAKAQGLRVLLMAPGGAQPLRGEAREAQRRWQEGGARSEPFAIDACREADVIVDALFGTGLARALDDPWRSAVESINAAGKPVIAIDLPSGLHADTGSVPGVAVRASATVTFIALKAGLFTGKGPDHVGEILFDPLGLPADIQSRVVPLAQRLTARALCGLLPPRARTMHKGDAGRVLVVGGNRGMSGAVRLAGEAAYRGGAGLVTLATHRDHAPHVVAGRPEMIARAIDDDALDELVERADVLALGPGLGRDAWAERAWHASINAARRLVVDADGLNLLAVSARFRDDWVLTPHPGEAARLLGTGVAEVEADRFAAANAIVRRYGGVCVLKGAGTIVAAAGKLFAVCDRGNPGMASGGMGDVLAGVIAALMAQGLAPFDAARLGVYVHARAGDAAVRDGGEIGLLASDVMPRLRGELNRLSRC